MNTIAFFALIVITLSGLVAAKNNFFVKTYFKAGTNCTNGSGKAQEKFSMNVCLDTMQNYVDGKTGYVDQNDFSDYKCTTAKKAASYHLSVCQPYDAQNDLYPTAF